MGAWGRKGVAILLALICVLTPAVGAGAENAGITVNASVRLTEAPEMGQDALAVLNGLLSRMTFTLQAKDGAGRFAVAADGTEILSAAVFAETGQTLTVFGPAGGAYLTAPGDRDALALLTGRWEEDVPPLKDWAESYPAAAKKLWDALEKHCKPWKVKDRVYVRNTAGAASYIEYALKEDALTAGAWKEALKQLLPAIRKTPGVREDVYRSVQEVLEGLTFSGTCTFKRLLDQNGRDMGLQFTGTAAWKKEKRKVTLFFGYTPGKGGYFSLRLPAVRGENNLRVVLDYAEKAGKTQNSWTLNASYERTYGGKSESADLEAALTQTLGSAEKWTGKIRYSRTENKIRTQWTLTPKLSTDGKALAGTVRWTRQEGKKAAVKGEITLRIQKSASVKKPKTLPEIRDLRGMTEKAARAAVQAEWIPMTGAAVRLIRTLTEEERALLTHALRTEKWMYGPAVSPLPEGDSWTVKEDNNQ